MYARIKIKIRKKIKYTIINWKLDKINSILVKVILISLDLPTVYSMFKLLRSLQEEGGEKWYLGVYIAVKLRGYNAETALRDLRHIMTKQTPGVSYSSTHVAWERVAFTSFQTAFLDRFFYSSFEKLECQKRQLTFQSLKMYERL